MELYSYRPSACRHLNSHPPGRDMGPRTTCIPLRSMPRVNSNRTTLVGHSPGGHVCESAIMTVGANTGTPASRRRRKAPGSWPQSWSLLGSPTSPTHPLCGHAQRGLAHWLTLGRGRGPPHSRARRDAPGGEGRGTEDAGPPSVCFLRDGKPSPSPGRQPWGCIWKH